MHAPHRPPKLRARFQREGHGWRDPLDQAGHAPDKDPLRDGGRHEQHPQRDAPALPIDHDPQAPPPRRERAGTRHEGHDTHIVEAHETQNENGAEHAPREPLDAPLPRAGDVVRRGGAEPKVGVQVPRGLRNQERHHHPEDPHQAPLRGHEILIQHGRPSLQRSA